MTDATEQQRYPIGRFPRADAYSTAERTAHIARLASQPERLRAAVATFTEHDWQAPYRPGGWTTRQLVHHVADSHANAYIRVKLGLTETQPTVKPYDESAWAALADSALAPSISLTMFEAVHTRFLAVLHAMTEPDFARTIFHPENGVMSLDEVVAMYAWHGDHHIAHLLAYRAAS